MYIYICKCLTHWSSQWTSQSQTSALVLSSFSHVDFPFSTPPQTGREHKHVQTCVDRQTKVTYSLFPPFTSLGAFGWSSPWQHLTPDLTLHDLFLSLLPFSFRELWPISQRVYTITLETLSLCCSQIPQGVWGKQKRQLIQGQTHIPPALREDIRQGSIMFMATLVQSNWLGNQGIWTAVCQWVVGGVFLYVWE